MVFCIWIVIVGLLTVNPLRRTVIEHRRHVRTLTAAQIEQEDGGQEEKERLAGAGSGAAGASGLVISRVPAFPEAGLWLQG